MGVQLSERVGFRTATKAVARTVDWSHLSKFHGMKRLTWSRRNSIVSAPNMVMNPFMVPLAGVVLEHFTQRKPSANGSSILLGAS